MSVVRPFAAKVVRADWAGRVVAPMLESLEPDERAKLLGAQADSYLHVTRSEADFPPGATPEEIRAADAAALRRLIGLGAYDDWGPAMFVYRLRDRDREHTGVVAEVDVEAFAGGQVRRHESVQPSRVDALVRHFRVVPARSELVALLHPDAREVADVVQATCETPPMLRFMGDDGLEQTVWRVGHGTDVATLATTLGARRHYIADGHHRVAATVREWESLGRLPRTGVLCVMYPAGELDLMAFHRRVRGPVDAGDLLSGIRRGFDVVEVDEPADAVGCFGLYVDKGWYAVAAKAGTPPPAGVAGLDATLLHQRVLGPVCGISVDDPRLEMASERIPAEHLAKRCDEDGGALFLLRAATVDQLIDVADRGEVMMPKTTYFRPKPQAGIFVRV